MAQFIRDYCLAESRQVAAVRRLHDRYVHLKHRLASANIRLAAHVAKCFRHHALSYADLLQEAVCGLMQMIPGRIIFKSTPSTSFAATNSSIRRCCCLSFSGTFKPSFRLANTTNH